VKKPSQAKESALAATAREALFAVIYRVVQTPRRLGGSNSREHRLQPKSSSSVIFPKRPEVRFPPS
jgi:hypothetical protein